MVVLGGRGQVLMSEVPLYHRQPSRTNTMQRALTPALHAHSVHLHPSPPLVLVPAPQPPSQHRLPPTTRCAVTLVSTRASFLRHKQNPATLISTNFRRRPPRPPPLAPHPFITLAVACIKNMQQSAGTILQSEGRMGGPYRDGPASGENKSHLCRRVGGSSLK